MCWFTSLQPGPFQCFSESTNRKGRERERERRDGSFDMMIWGAMRSALSAHSHKTRILRKGTAVLHAPTPAGEVHTHDPPQTLLTDDQMVTGCGLGPCVPAPPKRKRKSIKYHPCSTRTLCSVRSTARDKRQCKCQSAPRCPRMPRCPVPVPSCAY